MAIRRYKFDKVLAGTSWAGVSMVGAPNTYIDIEVAALATTLDSYAESRGWAFVEESPALPIQVVTCQFLNGLQCGGISAHNSDSNFNSWGMYDDTIVDWSAVGVTDAGGQSLKQTTDASSGAVAILQLNKKVHLRETNPDTLIKFALEDLTDLRFWAGQFTNSSAFGTAMLQADEPTESYAGIRFSTNASDTNFQFMSSAGSTVNVEDSGIEVTTDIFYVRVTANNTTPSFTIEILDNAFVSLASHTFTTNIPAAATPIAIGSGISPTVATAKTIRHYFFYGTNRGE